MAGEFEVYQDETGEFGFRLTAGNGAIITAVRAARPGRPRSSGVEPVKKHAPDAAVVDLSE